MNVVRIVEALYRFDLEDHAWLKLAAAELRPLLDRHGLGVIGGLYECPDPTAFRPTDVVYQDVALKFQCPSSLSPLYVANGMLSKSWFLGADLRGWEDIGCVRTGNLRANGAADQLSLNTVEPNGSGCWFGSFQTTRVPLSDAACFTLTTVAQHLSAAHRLRRSSAFARMSAEQADAVFDARGRMDHATESTKGPAAHALLEHAVRAMGEVRSLRRDDGPTAAERWPSLIGVRWTLVEQHDVDGRTWVLAIDNRAKAAATLFSERERQVVQLALSGHENKAIAYDLGLATSTVRVLLSRAAAKVGAHSRQTLMKRAAQLGIAATKR